MLDKEYTKGEIIDMGIYDFFEMIAKANVNEVMTIRQILENARAEMLKFANAYKAEMFDREEIVIDSKFDENFTRTLHCFALAMYLDKKVEVCVQRIDDLTPECFKNKLN